MSKRNAEQKIAQYHEKIRKIEARMKKPYRRRIILSSESSDSDNNSNDGTIKDNTDTPSVEGILEGKKSPTPMVESEPDPELDAEFLAALGATTNDDPQPGEKIHDNLTQLWLPLLKKGMSKEDKEKVLKEYPIPVNCALLQAPKLNPEILAAITESSRNRDNKILNTQQQLGAGITAINRALDIILNKEDNQFKVIKYHSDACRILSDLHHVETQARIKMIIPSLDKSFLNIIQDTCRDDTLFGSKLSEKIKASKAIEKQSLQIKKSITNASSSIPSGSQPAQFRGNWTVPPRYPLKTGQGGTKKYTSSHKSQLAPTAPTKPPTRAQTQHR